MAKFVALICVVSGFFLAGRYLAFLYKEKMMIMNDALIVVVEIQNKLAYSRPTLIDVVQSLCQKGCGRLTDFAKMCNINVSQGTVFPEAWLISLENKKEICRLLGDQKENFILFGKSLGTTDIRGQLAACEYYKNIFEAEANKRRETCEKYSGLFPQLGALLGIAAVIFLI